MGMETYLSSCIIVAMVFHVLGQDIPNPHLSYGFEDDYVSQLATSGTFTAQPTIGNENLAISTNTYNKDYVKIVDGIKNDGMSVKKDVNPTDSGKYGDEDRCLHAIDCEGFTMATWLNVNLVDGLWRNYTIVRTGNYPTSESIFEGLFVEMQTSPPYPISVVAISRNGTRYKMKVNSNKFFKQWGHLTITISQEQGMKAYVNGDGVTEYYEAPSKSAVVVSDIPPYKPVFGADETDFIVDEIKFWFSVLGDAVILQNYIADVPVTTTPQPTTTPDLITTAASTTVDQQLTTAETEATTKENVVIETTASLTTISVDATNPALASSSTQVNKLTTSAEMGEVATSASSTDPSVHTSTSQSGITSSTNLLISTGTSFLYTNTTIENAQFSTAGTTDVASTDPLNDLTTVKQTTFATTVAIEPAEEKSLIETAIELNNEVNSRITEETTVEVANEVNDHTIEELTKISNTIDKTDLSETESVQLMAAVSGTAAKVLTKQVKNDADLLVVADDIFEKSTEIIQRESEDEEAINAQGWSIHVVPKEDTSDDLTVLVDSTTSVEISKETLQSSSENGVNSSTVVVAAFLYPEAEEIATIPASKIEESSKNLSIVSRILTLLIYPPIAKNVTFTQSITKGIREKVANGTHKLFCALINPKNAMWVTRDCTALTDGSTGHVKCTCNHLTNFAILMQVVEFEISEYHRQNLKMITFIGSSISIFCLIMSLLVFFLISNVKGHRTERYHIHANLALAILLGQVTFLSGSGQPTKTIGCKVTAILLHFFFLSAFCWMLVEGLHLYNLVVKVFRSGRSRIGYYYMIGWGTPLLICVISASSAYSGYGEDKNCWLEISSTGVIWAFVGPALFVVGVNILVLVKVTRVISNLSNAKDTCKNFVSDKQTVIVCAKAVAVLLPILGLTWVFGIMAFNQETIIFQYLFVITNSLQGFFLFVFHIVLNTETRSALAFKTGRFHSNLPSYSGSKRTGTGIGDSSFSNTKTTSYSRQVSRDTPEGSVTSSSEWSHTGQSKKKQKLLTKRSHSKEFRPSSASSQVSPTDMETKLHENAW